MRLLTLSAVFLALSSAFLLYALNNDTRQLESRVHSQERAVSTARSDIAVLKAERAHLARPDRIAPLARELGLVTPAPGQFAPVSGNSADLARFATILEH